MNGYLVLVYFVCFALIAGAAFALMWGNMKSINELMDKPKTKRHPEAPEPGDEVMYVDVSQMNSREFQHKKDWLENLYNESDDGTSQSS
jgi:hypothetical protein